MVSVNSSPAGSPSSSLYLIPKSSPGPPGLWLAVSTIPPCAFPPSRWRITTETAGVVIIPCWGIQILATPLPARTRQMLWIASVLKYRPSPATTNLLFHDNKVDNDVKESYTIFATAAHNTISCSKNLRVKHFSTITLLCSFNKTLNEILNVVFVAVVCHTSTFFRKPEVSGLIPAIGFVSTSSTRARIWSSNVCLKWYTYVKLIEMAVQLNINDVRTWRSY